MHVRLCHHTSWTRDSVKNIKNKWADNKSMISDGGRKSSNIVTVLEKFHHIKNMKISLWIFDNIWWHLSTAMIMKHSKIYFSSITWTKVFQLWPQQRINALKLLIKLTFGLNSLISIQNHVFRYTPFSYHRTTAQATCYWIIINFEEIQGLIF